jgi:hypothetical protein
LCTFLRHPLNNFFVRMFCCEHDNVFVRMLGSEYVQNLHSD